LKLCGIDLILLGCLAIRCGSLIDDYDNIDKYWSSNEL